MRWCEMLVESGYPEDTSSRLVNRVMLSLPQNQCNAGDVRKKQGSEEEISAFVELSDAENASE